MTTRLRVSQLELSTASSPAGKQRGSVAWRSFGDASAISELLSLSRMVGEWKIWKDLLDQGTFEANDHGRPDPGVQQKW